MKTFAEGMEEIKNSCKYILMTITIIGRSYVGLVTACVLPILEIMFGLSDIQRKNSEFKKR